MNNRNQGQGQHRKTKCNQNSKKRTRETKEKTQQLINSKYQAETRKMLLSNSIYI